MKTCNKCGNNYPESYEECPFCKIREKNEAKKKQGFDKKYILYSAAAVAWLCIVAIIVAALFNFGNSKLVSVNATVGLNNNNKVVFQDGVFLIDDSRNLEKKIKDITYNESTNEYTLSYKNIPDSLIDLSIGDIFVVPANEKSKTYSFNVGFSGVVTAISNESISFTIPEFKEIFSDFNVNTGSLQASNVVFVPEEGVELEEFIPNDLYTASLGTNKAQTDKFSFGDFSAETSYQKADKASQLDGYDLIAKKMSLKIKQKFKTPEDHDFEISGKVTLNYPAVKFNFAYNSDGDNVENYDVGFISNQSVNVTMKASGNIGIPEKGVGVGDFGIIDLKDTDDIENGKIVLGSYFLGYQIPLMDNVKNRVPVIGIGLVFQVCLTANGEIELECNASESGLLRIEANSNGKQYCELKNSKCPNPVLGEEMSEGENYDDVQIKSTAKGSVDLNAAISLDVGFAVLGTIPAKLAIDVINFNLVSAFEKEESSSLKFDIVENSNLKDIDMVSFYQFKTQATIKINVGAQFKIGKLKYDLGEMGYQNTLWNKVWYQYPKPTEFSLSECDFGGIQLGQGYTLDEMNDLFYARKEEMGKSNLMGEIKDKFLQSTVSGIVNKINYNIEDILDLLPIAGHYDLACYSDGAIYFLENNVVKAELITGDEVFNRSYISHASDDKLIRSVYSEPSRQESIKINIGELGIYVLEQIGLGELAKYDGTSLSIYYYTSKDNANMNIYFDGSGNVIFILVY